MNARLHRFFLAALTAWVAATCFDYGSTASANWASHIQPKQGITMADWPGYIGPKQGITTVDWPGYIGPKQGITMADWPGYIGPKQQVVNRQHGLRAQQTAMSESTRIVS